VRAIGAKRFVLDGEIVVPEGKQISFELLLSRIHPAESRIQKLAAQHPATLIVFDLLVDENGKSLIERTLPERRKRLEALAERHLRGQSRLLLSPWTDDPAVARRWLTTGGALDGVVAKRRDIPYASGTRLGMQKIKQRRTADCVVGGFRYATSGKIVGSLLLGLYDPEGLLHHVGFTSSLSARDRKRITPTLEQLVKPPGFTGKAPGGPSRWSGKRASEWQPLATRLVVEVEYDHVSGDRFRHGTKFLRFRPDKAPKQCTFEQIERRGGSLLKLLAPPAMSSRGRRKA
jgi:ATP-dependent DNA ligase